MTSGEPRGLCIDFVVSLDDRSFYVSGWMTRRQTEITRLTAVSPEGGRIEVLERAATYPRPDVDAAFPDSLGPSIGFACFIEASASSRRHEGWHFELEAADGEILEEDAPAVVRNPEAAQQAVLDGLRYQQPGRGADLVRDHTFPALRLLAERSWAAPVLDRVVQFGAPPADPQVSIVVPLYRQIEMVELQLALFANDPALSEVDLIYVLDSPELASDLIERCEGLHELYRQPFRVATLQRHSGYAGANNVGASLSKGRLLVLLSSDAMPRDSGWLSTMTRAYESTSRVGALAPKLLYEDDTIQHAGLYFDLAPGNQLWVKAHYFKGMHRSLPAANKARAVPAVTGACLMIARELYLEHNGLLSLYVQGGYEDSDLCLRLRRAGYENWYLPEVELYHLEGQSYEPAARERNARYNCWLHTELRGDAIAEAMAEFSRGTPELIEPR